MRIRSCRFVLGCIAIVFWAQVVSAEQPADATYEDKITAVRQLIKSKNVDGAIAMLEVMFESRADDQLVVNLLRNCYEDTRNWGKAELLARRLVERDPGNYNWRLYLAESLAKENLVDSAVRAYKETFAMTPASDSGRYYAILHSMMAFGAHSGALEIVDSVRARSGNTRAFGLQRGQLLQMERRFAEATEEMFTVLATDTGYAAGDAEAQLLSLLAYPEATAEAERVLSSISSEVNSGRALRLLMTHAIKSGQYDRALAFAIRQDTIQKGEGQPLADFVRQCFDRRAYDPVVKGADYTLARYKNGSFMSELRFDRAEALAILGHHDAALSAYREIASAAPTPADLSEAYCGIAILYLDQLNDPTSARTYFDSVKAQSGRGLPYLRAVRLAPLCDIRGGDYASARITLNRIIEQRFSDDIMEEAEYRLAILDLFEHRFDSTKAALKKLTVDHPRGLYVNDAMQLMIDMDPVLPDTTLLVLYARGVECEMRRMTDSARRALGKLIDATDQKLADVALYRLAKMELEQSDTTATLRALDHLTENFAESFYRPYGLKLKADLIVDRPGERDKARLIYRELLEKYPNSPFASDARTRLRALEKEGRVG